jgi:hypothetical protein
MLGLGGGVSWLYHPCGLACVLQVDPHSVQNAVVFFHADNLCEKFACRIPLLLDALQLCAGFVAFALGCGGAFNKR